MERQKLELYFHIPFCVRKCFYCDFLSAPADAETQKAYMEALLEETTRRAEDCKDYEICSIFIGGGTPSIVEAGWIEALMSRVRQHYHLLSDAEITIECNPGTVDAEKLRRYRAAGINRMSIGLQSADDAELASIGRIHTWQQFLHTWEAAAEAGFENLNLDIMSALPGQTPEDYLRTLEKVLSLSPRPKHISAYSLIVEEGTCFGDLQSRGALVLPTEEEERQMYYDTDGILREAGYERYEISNYALPGYACRHNCGYWKRVPYLGLGLGASSLMENTRFHNTGDLQKYLRKPLDCREDQQYLNRQEQMEECMFLGLRMTQGVGERDFYETFDAEMTQVYGAVIDANLTTGLLYWREGGAQRYLALTGKGMDLSNYVMAQFLFED